LNAAYGFRPPTVPNTIVADARKCQKAIAKAASGLSTGWARALASCEDANARGVNPAPVDCSTDPDGDIARVRAKAASRVATCDSFAGIPGCATSGTAPAVATCLETAIDDVVPRYTEVPYP